MNQPSLTDQFITAFDLGLRTLTQVNRKSQRINPAHSVPEDELTDKEKKLAGRLMRVNHAGEVAAQGLYNGQALTARNEETLRQMQVSAREEEDHLAWCEQRLEELHFQRSLIGPIWYFGSYAIGATAGLIGDRWSLGFVSETEAQVEEHLTDHLNKIPAKDYKSRAILEQMKQDEHNHGEKARNLGGKPLPAPVAKAMHFVSRVMTTGAYWI